MEFCGASRLLRLDTSKLDHLGPLLGFVGDELTKISRRACHLDPLPDLQVAPSVLGSASPALIASLSVSTTSAGVFLGAPMPYHELPHNPATNSAIPGKSGMLWPHASRW